MARIPGRRRTQAREFPTARSPPTPALWLGGEAPDWIGRAWTELLHAGCRDEAVHLFGTIADASAGTTCDSALRLAGTAAGRPIGLKLTARDAGVDGFQVLARIVEDESLPSLALRTRSERHALIQPLVTNMQDTIVVLDALGRILNVFGSYARIAGWSRDELVGRSAFELVHPDDRGAARRRVLLNVLDPRREGRFPMSLRLATRNGEYRWVEGIAANRFKHPFVRAMVLTLRYTHERVLAMRAFADSEERFRVLTEQSRDVTLIMSGSGHVEYASPTLARVLGIEPAELVGQSVLSRTHPDDLALARDKMQRIVADPDRSRPREFEVRIRHADGDYRWLAITAVNLRANSAVNGIALSARDIGDRKRMEAALLQAQAQLDAALSGAHIGVWILELASGRLTLDSSALRLLGIGPEWRATTREAFFVAVHRDDRALVDEWIARQVAQPLEWHEVEYRHVLRGGAVRWIQLRGRASTFDAGVPTRLSGAAIAIDRRKAAELSLRQRDQQLQTALWGARIGFWTHDVVADVGYQHPSFFAMTGLSPEEWARERHPHRARTHPSDRPRVERALAECLASRAGVYECEYRFAARGDWLWFLDRGHVVERDANGRATRVAGVTIDVSEQRRLEQAVQEAASREQERIGRDLHDGLGQELTGVSLMLRALTDTIPAELAGAREELERVVRLVSRAISETRRLSHGLVPAGLEHGGLVRALHTLAEHAALTAGWDFAADEHGEPDRGVPDATAMHVYRIVQEALGNAARHSGAGRVWLRTRLHADRLRVCVEDDGSGPPAAPRAGGLGLRIMAHRARQIDADLSIEARPGGGTRVALDVPLAPAPARAAGPGP